MDEFLGLSEKGRENLIIEATSRTAFRKGNWLMIPPYKGPKFLKTKGIETGNAKNFQLYNLDNDPSQKENLASSMPKVLEEMVNEFKEIRGTSFENISQIKFKN